MKKVLFAMVALLPLLTGCSNEEDEAVNLYQTIWDGTRIAYDINGENPSVSYTFVFEFVSETNGKCVLQELNTIQYFTYTLTESVLTIDGSMAMGGDWYIVEHSKNEITLQAYRPHKVILKLKRVF